MNLGEFIQEKRKALEMSVEEVAAQVEISAAYLRNIEMDRVKSPSARVIFRLARALQVGLEEFERIFTNEEESVVEQKIEAIHQQFPHLRCDLELPTLKAKKQYLALLETLSKHPGK